MAGPLRVLHFADAHIDMANYGRHDPESGLPMRVVDFLKSLDTIVEAAIREQVDLVLFAGDAYKDRSPQPTYQREWGRRVMRLSRAGIPTLLLVGNHDLSPARYRAHALEAFDTLEVPFVQVLDQPALLGPDDLNGLPVQVIALPWITRSGLVAQLGLSTVDPQSVYAEMETRLTELVQDWLEQVDPQLPVILLAHGTVQGAKLGGERTIMLGGDLILPGSLVKDPRLDYAALGHIHKAQDLNEGNHPPVVYPGSIERVDFGEARGGQILRPGGDRPRPDRSHLAPAGRHPAVHRPLRPAGTGRVRQPGAAGRAAASRRAGRGRRAAGDRIPASGRT